MSHGSRRPRTISADGLARVEGEGSLSIEVRDGLVTDVALEIFEPPGTSRPFSWAGTSPRHPTSPHGSVGSARWPTRCRPAPRWKTRAGSRSTSGWLGSVGCSTAGSGFRATLCTSTASPPRFLRSPPPPEAPRQGPPPGVRGLDSNALAAHHGDRWGPPVHPVNVRVGGFYPAPDPDAVAALDEPLPGGRRDAALETVEWVAGFEFPDITSVSRFVALRDRGRYPIETGRPASSDGLDLTPGEFADLVVEEQVERSNALHARLAGRDAYLTGPLARYALNAASLPPLAARGPRHRRARSCLRESISQHRRASRGIGLRLRRGTLPPQQVRTSGPSGDTRAAPCGERYRGHGSSPRIAVPCL